MNAIFFGLKRAHQSTLRLARPMLARFGLTPARFDLLFAISRQAAYRGALQSELRRELGVTAPTITRMVRSLEQLGFVMRKPWADKRQRCIKLTAEGLVRLRRAFFATVSSGAAQHAVDCALGRERWYDESFCFFEMWAAESMLKRVRTAFSDVATLYYSYHPDD